jgi:hypothetical protein
MEQLADISPKIQFTLREYMRWYFRNFLPTKRFGVFFKVEDGKVCVYFSYDLTSEIDACIRRCKKSRDYDDCFVPCYEDVVSAAEEFLFEQPYALEDLLKKRGISEVESDYDWGGDGEKTFRWVRLCVPRA